MKSLAALNEAFIERANRSILNNVPINAKTARELPVLPTDRWAQVKTPEGTSLSKTFDFQNNEFRDRFILAILNYEEHYEHRGTVTFSDKKVSVSIATRHIDVVTELDKEYTRFCDTLYRDAVYNRLHGRPHRPEQNIDEP